METLLMKFIETLDVSVKQSQKKAGFNIGECKISLSQMQYINTIHLLKNPTLSEVAERLGVTKASVTAGINNLLELGFVEKNQSDSDKRAFHVSLTKESEKIVMIKHEALEEYVGFIKSTLTEDEAKMFEETLNKLVRVFNDKTEVIS